MGRLIAAEFRKTLTTNVWWVLLICSAVVALLVSWLGSLALSGLIHSVRSSVPATGALVDDIIDKLPLSAAFLARGINVATVFPMLFGVLGFANELSRKTITTTYLTAPNRGSLLTAKGITYAAWGAIFGFIICAVSSIGILIPSGPLPDAGNWVLMIVAGVLLSTLMALLGLGVGALLGSVVGSAILLLMYTMFVELIISSALSFSAHIWTGWLINVSADGTTSALASQTITDKALEISQSFGNHPPASALDTFRSGINALTEASSNTDWWASGLIFAGWVAIFVGLGWLRSTKRDIT